MTALISIFFPIVGQLGAGWESAQDIIDIYAPYGVAFEEIAVTERFVV